MSVAYPITKGKNAINIYDKEFDLLTDYQIRLTDKSFCSVPVVVDVDGVFDCNDNVKVSFNLPCMDVGEYVLEVIDANSPSSEPIYKFNSMYY